MKILVLTQSYPSNKSKEHMFIHVRNLFYQENGADVTVLSFSSSSSYIYEGIKVISEKDYKKNCIKYDIIVSHASNVRNNYRFLKKYDKELGKLIFIFHGHEVLRISKEYPDDYFYITKNTSVRKVLQNMYDSFKFWVFRNYLPRIAYKSQFIFVSDWLRKKFYRNLKINSDTLYNHDHVINNCVGKVFEENDYKQAKNTKYDFITIRGNLDGSKYCVDIINELATQNPSYNFLLIGKGHYFEYNSMASNITWINKQMNHDEMIELINNSRFALMPTREDTQGVMTCELATFGIPTITSDIEVCREIFAIYPNVILVPNSSNQINLKYIIENYKKRESNHKYYTIDKTLKKEWYIISKQ